MALQYVKALHIVFVVSWFSGLFYLVRLFVYHTEALQEVEPKRSILAAEHFKNEQKLYRIITTPAMVLTVLTASIMLYLNPGYLQAGWMHIKLTFVVGLIAYHFKCGHIMRQLGKEQSTWTSIQLRLWNEVATLFLVAIVFIVVLKHNMNWLYGTIGFILFAILIMMVVRIVKRFRE